MFGHLPPKESSDTLDEANRELSLSTGYLRSSRDGSGEVVFLCFLVGITMR